MQEALKQGKGRLRRLKVFVDGRKTKFWDALKEELEFNAKAADSKAEASLFGGPPVEAAQQLMEIREAKRSHYAYKGTISVVEDAEVKMELENERIGKYSALIKQIEKQGDDRKASKTREV